MCYFWGYRERILPKLLVLSTSTEGTVICRDEETIKGRKTMITSIAICVLLITMWIAYMIWSAIRWYRE